MFSNFKKRKLKKDFYFLENRLDLLEKCSPGGYFLTATYVRNIVLSLDAITSLNDKSKILQILSNIDQESILSSRNMPPESLFLLPSELTRAIFTTLYKGTLLNNAHLDLGVIELLGNLTRKGKLYRSIRDEDKNYMIGENSLFKAVDIINEEYEVNKLDLVRRDEDIQNIIAMADFRKSIEDGSLGIWARSWKQL